MKQTAHTPGPLMASASPDGENWSLFAGKGNHPACYLIAYVFGSNKNVAANAARLVACWNACEGIANPEAVPDLLIACELFMRDLPDQEARDMDYVAARNLARAALAKAKP